VTDLHDDEGREFGDYEDCEFCWQEQIRYVHALRHLDWKNVIYVGRICANNLSGNSEVNTTERRLRNRAQRRQNFAKLKSWKVSAKGNEWIRYQGHHIVLIVWSNGKYRLRIDGELGKIEFDTARDAKLKAFDVIMHRIHRQR
jgi:hypothetical protein